MADKKAYLPRPLIVTRDKWFLKSKAFAAHPKEVVEQRLHLQESEGDPVPFIDLAVQQRIIRPSLQKRFHCIGDG